MSERRDSSSQTNAVIAADGSVTYDFAGHVSAQGLDLGPGPEILPAGHPDNMVRWLRTDGSWVAYSYAGDTPAEKRQYDLVLAAGDASGSSGFAAGVKARRYIGVANGAWDAFLIVETDGTDAGTKVSVQVDTPLASYTRVLLDGNNFKG